MACNTYQCSLELCCQPEIKIENVLLNFGCNIDPTTQAFNNITFLWTGNTSVPQLYRGILQCYNLNGAAPALNYDPNAFEPDSQYIFTGAVSCNLCTQRFPCAIDTTCFPCNGITSDGKEATLYDRCQPTNCLTWDNPIVFHYYQSQEIQRIKVHVGTSVGDIDFTFSAFWRPNRFQIWWDYNGASGGQAGMTKVCDSLFVGEGLRHFRNDVKDYWRGRQAIVWENCSTGCGSNQTWRAPARGRYTDYCLTSGFTDVENSFLAMTRVDRDNNWGAQFNPTPFPWGIPVPAFGAPGQIGVVTNYPRLSGNSRSSDGDIKLRFYKPNPYPDWVYIYSYQGFVPTGIVSSVLGLENQAYLRQIDGACN
jgi:hypothetical protein